MPISRIIVLSAGAAIIILCAVLSGYVSDTDPGSRRRVSVNAAVSSARPALAPADARRRRALLDSLESARAAIADAFNGTSILESAASVTPRAARRALGRRLARALLVERQLVFAVGGYSVTVARGNYYSHAWPFAWRSWLAPVAAAANATLAVRNMAVGGVPSFPFAWCARELLGGDAALVGWEFSLNEPGSSCTRAEPYVRRALRLAARPAVALVDAQMNPTGRAALVHKLAPFGVHAVDLASALPSARRRRRRRRRRRCRRRCCRPRCRRRLTKS